MRNNGSSHDSRGIRMTSVVFGGTEHLVTHERRSGSGLSSPTPMTPDFWAKLPRSVAARASGLWATGDRLKIYRYLLTYKITGVSGVSEDKEPLERGFDDSRSKSYLESEGFIWSQSRKVCHFYHILFTGKAGGHSCNSEIPRLDDCLSHLAPEGRWTPQDDPIQHSLAPNMGAKPGVGKGLPMEPVDSKRFSSLSPQTRGLVPLVERRNAWR